MEELKKETVISEKEEIFKSVTVKCPLIPNGWKMITQRDISHLFLLEISYIEPIYKHPGVQEWWGVQFADQYNPWLINDKMTYLSHVEGKNIKEQSRDALKQTLLRLHNDKDVFAVELSLTSSPYSVPYEKGGIDHLLIRVRDGRSDTSGDRLALTLRSGVFGDRHVCTKCDNCLKNDELSFGTCSNPSFDISKALLFPGTVREATDLLLSML